MIHLSLHPLIHKLICISILLVAEKEKTRSLGKAALGGPFSLINQDGERKTDRDFHDTWVLLYFGFTFCPDICPDELEKMATVITTIGKYIITSSIILYTIIILIIDNTKGVPDLQPLFITVDPERDTPAVLKSYLKGD